MKRYCIFALAFLAVLFTGCKQADLMTRTPIFKVLGPDGTEKSEVAIDGKSQYVDFKVLASEMWTASVTGDDAFSLPVSSGGSGSTLVQLKATANESEAVRTATLEFVLGSYKKTFAISQAVQEPYILVSPKEYQAASDGEEFSISVETNQEGWEVIVDGEASWLTEVSRDATQIVYRVPENTVGNRQIDLIFRASNNYDLVDVCTIKQNKVAEPPIADLLDVIFNADRSATDKSAAKRNIDSGRLDADVSVKMVDKYNCYAACFNNPTIARSGLEKGYYRVPYTIGDQLGSALGKGYTYEVVFSPYFDQQASDNKQVKMFSATQAGGTGLCFRAGSGEINFETHIGGSWAELYSGVIPQKNTYYHVIGIYDKENGIVTLYVDGVLRASKNVSGDFKHMDTSVDSRWFGIGADPSSTDKGEASFYGEVVIARLYSRPITADEVRALYKLVK